MSGLEEAAAGFQNELENGESSDTIETQDPGAVESEPSDSQAQSLQDLIDLESHKGKFKLNGEEMSAEDIRNGWLRQSDYTKKTQALAEERKYLDNLSADLERVRSGQNTADQFKEVYPEKFHAYLDMLQQTARDNPQAGAQQQGQEQYTNAELAQLKQELAELRGTVNSSQEKAAEEKLNSWFDAASAKHSFEEPQLNELLEDQVIKKAEALGSNLNAETIEKLYKETHDSLSALIEGSLSKRLDKQKGVNREGRDIGKGGATPGAAPKNPRNLKEAAELAMGDDFAWG